MTDIVTREEREGMRRAMGKGVVIHPNHIARLLDTIDALEERDKLRAIAKAALGLHLGTSWADYSGEPGESDDAYNARLVLWLGLEE